MPFFKSERERGSDFKDARIRERRPTRAGFGVVVDNALERIEHIPRVIKSSNLVIVVSVGIESTFVQSKIRVL